MMSWRSGPPSLLGCVCVCVCKGVYAHGSECMLYASMSADLSGHRAWLFSSSHGGSSTQEAPLSQILEPDGDGQKSMFWLFLRCLSLRVRGGEKRRVNR